MIGYLIVRFEWRMAAAAVASLVLDLVLTAAVYSLVGFEVTPSTRHRLPDDSRLRAVRRGGRVRQGPGEHPRHHDATSETYGEAANLAVNQTLMRSINTGLVALLPVGGLLFIGAGLLGAGTLKDLGLVLFVGMGAAVYSSIFFATPVLVTLKQREPKLQAHTQRVLTRRKSAEIKRRAGQAALDADTASDSDRELVVATAKAAARGTGKREPAKRPAAKPANRSGQPPTKGQRRRR